MRCPADTLDKEWEAVWDGVCYHHFGMEKSCAAQIWATQKLRNYMLVYSIILIARMDPLKYLFEKQIPTNRIAKWVILLSKFDISYVTQKAIKGQVVPDFLASNPILREIAREHEFPNEGIMNIEVEEEWRLNFDRAANRNGYGIGILLISLDQIHSPLSFWLQFDCTNNTAEYETCIVGLEIAL